MLCWSLLRQVAPIDTLPVELIAYIFVLATHTTDYETASSSEAVSININSITIPLVLSTVNKRWRNIALSTSALWTTLCVTIQDIVYPNDDLALKLPALDATQLVTYLSLSRKYPVDILIDARDPDWDFSENDSSSAGFYYTADYIHPFTCSHMTTALEILLPHARRWRTLTVLTDTWAPMDAALAILTKDVGASDVPLLESLTLMRCNEFASYSDFSPGHMRDRQRLPFGRDFVLSGDKTPLPRLRALNLTGVHVDWNNLPFLLAPQTAISGGLRSLELKYHSQDVRPCSRAFCDILRACPALYTLSVFISGPSLDSEHAESAVSLPHLGQLHLGYTTAHDACHLIHMLDAPNLTTLTLEDETHLASPLEENVQGVLQYLSTGSVSSTEDDDSSNAEAQDGMSDGSASVTSGSTTTTSTAAAPDLTESQFPPFPLLQDVTLTRVVAPADAFALFFASQHSLQRLELVHVPEHAVKGLLPQTPKTIVNNDTSTDTISTNATTSTTPCPCPDLRVLLVRAAQVDVGFVTNSLPRQRVCGGARLLWDVEVYVDRDTPRASAGCVCDEDSVDSDEEEEKSDDDGDVGLEVDMSWARKCGTAVKVFRSPTVFEPIGDFDMDCGDDGAGDPFALGGAFNDPAFDEYYGGQRVWASHP